MRHNSNLIPVAKTSRIIISFPLIEGVGRRYRSGRGCGAQAFRGCNAP